MVHGASEGDSWTSAPERASEPSKGAAGSDTAGSTSFVAADGPAGPGDRSGSSFTELGASTPDTPAGADLDSFWGGGSGGAAALLETATGCLLCGGASHGLLAFGSVAHDAAAHDELEGSSAAVTDLPLISAPGDPRQLPGPNAGVPASGGGGGSGAAFMLFGLAAVLAATLRPWTTDLRLPTATWPPSAYVPPIESPG